MTEDFTTTALRYLLDELAEPERAAFELRLERDPAAAAAFKTCADSLGRFGLERGSPDNLAPEELQLGWAELQARIAEDSLQVTRFRPARAGWRRPLWPMAAAALLALNLWQWFKPAPSVVSAASPSTRASSDARLVHESAVRPLTAAEVELVAAVAKNVPPGKATDPRVAVELQRLEALRQQFQALQRDRDALAKDYGQIVNQLIPAGAVETGAGRLVAMELVDNASYNSGNRNGLLEQAKALLTEPGIVAIPSPSGKSAPPTSPSAPSSTPGATVLPSAIDLQSTTVATTISAGNVVTTAPDATPSLGAAAAGSLTFNSVGGTTAGIGAITLSTSGPTSITDVADTGDAFTISTPGTLSAPSAAPDANSSAAAANSTTPYAWSVYDDTAHQGYVNLYNLPTVTSGAMLELWVQPAGSTQFQPVGQVPSQFYGNSGSLYYQLPAATPTPSQILITVEPAASAPTSPSSTTVLRGP